MSDNVNIVVEEPVFESAEEASEVLCAMLKYFAKDAEDNQSLPEFLTSNIVIHEVPIDCPMEVRAQYRSATLNVYLPVDSSLSREKIEKIKRECLIDFSSSLDKMKTITLSEVYRRLKKSGQEQLKKGVYKND